MISYRPLYIIFSGIIIGLTSDYLMGSIILASMITGLIVGAQSKSFREASALALISTVVWVSILYIYRLLDTANMAMLNLLSSIAGIQLPLIFSIVFTLVLVLSLISAIFIHTLIETTK